MENKGIVVGTDQNLEWVLPWWWKNYSRTNALPVAFADFGMSDEARKWCEERGTVFSISPVKVASKNEMDSNLLKTWESAFVPYIWEARSSWFTKPFALLNSPFETGLWLDLDCEVFGNVESCFEYIDSTSGIALVSEHETIQEKYQKMGSHLPGEVGYNSGVIAFHTRSPILKKWAEASLNQNHQFVGDQDALSRVIFDEKYSVGQLPEKYNWLLMNFGFPDDPVIVHWAGIPKSFLKEYGLMSDLSLQLRLNFVFQNLGEK